MILSSTGLVQSMVNVVVALLLTPLAASACLPPLGGMITLMPESPARAQYPCIWDALSRSTADTDCRPPSRKRKCRQRQQREAERVPCDDRRTWDETELSTRWYVLRQRENAKRFTLQVRRLFGDYSSEVL